MCVLLDWEETDGLVAGYRIALQMGCFLVLTDVCYAGYECHPNNTRSHEQATPLFDRAVVEIGAKAREIEVGIVLLQASEGGIHPAKRDHRV